MEVGLAGSECKRCAKHTAMHTVRKTYGYTNVAPKDMWYLNSSDTKHIIQLNTQYNVQYNLTLNVN